MKPIAIFLLFIGTILILQGYYNQSTQCSEPKTVIKYIPRSLYEEQLSDNQNLEIFYKSMFEDVTPVH
jgi:hypothetical protein